MKKSSLLLTLSLGAVLGLFSCGGTADGSSSPALSQPWPGEMGGNIDPEQSTTFAFDTLLYITTYHGETAVHDEIIDTLQKLDSLFDPYNAPVPGVTSVYSLNHAGGEPLAVDPLLYEALQAALEAEEATGGLFDPLIGKVTALYKEAFYGEGHEPYLPDMDEVQSFIEEASGSSLVLGENYTVQIQGGAFIDLGGIAKGFALDKTIEILKSHGVCDFLIQLSGSSIGLGNNPERMDQGGAFRVRINTYVGDNDHILSARFNGLSTSATYEQQVMFGPDRYSHIINPQTGSAVCPNDIGVVIGDIESNAMLDAFSTAVCLTPGKDLAALDESLNEKGYDVGLFAMKDGEDVYLSDGFEISGVELP